MGDWLKGWRPQNRNDWFYLGLVILFTMAFFVVISLMANNILIGGILTLGMLIWAIFASGRRFKKTVSKEEDE